MYQVKPATESKDFRIEVHIARRRLGGRLIVNVSGFIPRSISFQATGAATGKPERALGE